MSKLLLSLIAACALCLSPIAIVQASAHGHHHHHHHHHHHMAPAADSGCPSGMIGGSLCWPK